MRLFSKAFNMKTMLLMVLLLLCYCFVVAETKLTYPQRQSVERQGGTLREVEKKVQDGFSADEGKILLQKLDNIVADLERNKCPEDNTQVIDMKTRVKAARDSIAKVTGSATEVVKENKEKAIEEKKEKPAEEKNITEKKEDKQPPNESKPAKETPPASNEVKLNYQQRQTVDRQLKNLVELEKTVNELNDQEPNYKFYPAPIVPGLGYQEKIDSIMKDLNHADCPAANSQVADILQRIEKVKSIIAQLEVKLKPKFEAYDKFTNISNYPNYEKDMEQLKRLSSKYNNPEKFYQNIERAKELLASYPADAEFFNALSKTYAPIINFKTIHGQNLLERMKSVQKHVLAFNEAKKNCGEQLTSEIDIQLKNASEMADKAVKEKKVAFFGGGVQQCMDKAQKTLDVLEAVKGDKDEVVVSYKDKYKKLKDEIAGMENSMEAEILANTMLPEELYTGADKEELKNRIKDAWKKAYPNDVILKIIMHTDGWNRTNKWSYNASGSEWSQTDMSVIMGCIVIKNDDKTATQYPAYINKDHLSGDKITMGVGTKGNAYVNKKMLLSNVK